MSTGSRWAFLAMQLPSQVRQLGLLGFLYVDVLPGWVHIGRRTLAGKCGAEISGMGGPVVICAHLQPAFSSFGLSTSLMMDNYVRGSTPVELTRAIQKCGRDGRWESALELLLQAFVHGEANSIHVGCCMSLCSRFAQWHAAIQLAAVAASFRLPPDVVIYSSALSACSRANEWLAALQIMWDGFNAGIQSDVTLHNSAISACAVPGKWRSALSLSCQVPRKDTFTMNGVLSAFQHGEWVQASSILEGMPCSRVGADAVTFNTLLNSLKHGESGEWKHAFAMFRILAQRHLQSQQITFNSSLRAVEASWQRALGIMTSMSCANVKADKITAASAISACGKAGFWQECLTILCDSEQSAVAFYSAIYACDNSGCWAMSLHLMEELMAANFQDCMREGHDE